MAGDSKWVSQGDVAGKTAECTNNGRLYVCRTVRRKVQTGAAVAQAASHDCGSAAARRNKPQREGVALYIQWVVWQAGIRWTSEGWVYQGRWRLEVVPTAGCDDGVCEE